MYKLKEQTDSRTRPSLHPVYETTPTEDDSHPPHLGARARDDLEGQQDRLTYRDSIDEHDGDDEHDDDDEATATRATDPLQSQSHPQTHHGSSSEKEYRFYKEDPHWDSLVNARHRPPGAFAIASGLALLLCVGYLLAWACTSVTRYNHVTKVNVILMVSDGFGPASETFARSYLQHLVASDHPSVREGGQWASLVPSGKDAVTDYRMTLPLDSLLIGSTRTRSSNSLVTDSAAGATAFSCGMKSYNGAIAVEPVGRNPCGTVLEAAKHKGYKTGLIVTSRITHATPAAFYAHVPDRDMEDKIAEHLVGLHPLGQQVDLAFGGGLCFFLPNSSSASCRTDDLDLISAAESKKNKDPKLKVITTRQEFDLLEDDSSALGTIALLAQDHMEYEIDRVAMTEPKQPSLSEMAVKGIKILRSAAKSQSAHGFLLMVEGSRIDMAAHDNDPVGHVHEILAYQKTVAAVKEQVDELNAAGAPTVLISVSDHETGGLSLGYQLAESIYPVYAWYPDALTNATRTAHSVAESINARASTITIEEITGILKEQLGVSDPDDTELNSIFAQKDDAGLWNLGHAISRLTSRRAQLGWSTEGHSGVDCNLYGYPRSLVAKTLGGNRENTEIGAFIAETMKLNLQQITTALQINQKSWYSAHSSKLDIPSQKSTTKVQHYHGEHRH